MSFYLSSRYFSVAVATAMVVVVLIKMTTHSMIWSQSNWMMLMILLFIVRLLLGVFVSYIKLLRYTNTVSCLLNEWIAFCFNNNSSSSNSNSITSKVFSHWIPSWEFKNIIFQFEILLVNSGSKGPFNFENCDHHQEDHRCFNSWHFINE